MTYTGEDRVLVEQFVGEDYFLNRIASFEVEYEMSWGAFLGQWLSEENHEELTKGDVRKYADFSEWAFLCTSMLPTLLTKDSECPPIEICEEPEKQKPDQGSGFWLLGGGVDRLVAI